MTKTNSNDQADELRREIAHTRAELGETVQALAARADVPARVKASASETADRVRESAAHTADRVRESAVHTAGRVREAGQSPVPWLVLAGGATAALLVVIGIRWRRG